VHQQVPASPALGELSSRLDYVLNAAYSIFNLPPYLPRVVGALSLGGVDNNFFGRLYDIIFKSSICTGPVVGALTGGSAGRGALGDVTGNLTVVSGLTGRSGVRDALGGVTKNLSTRDRRPSLVRGRFRA